jgi:hypothetical protein
MQLKAARSAGALYLLSPVAIPGLTLKTPAHIITMIFRRVLPKGERETFHLVCKGLLGQRGTCDVPAHERALHRDNRSGVHVGNRRDLRLSLLIMFTLYRIQQVEEDVASAAVVA